MNIILWVLSLKRQSTLQALSTPTSRFHELLASPRRARACSHCHLRNFLRFLEARRCLRTGKSSRPKTAVETSDFPAVGEMQMEAATPPPQPFHQQHGKPSQAPVLPVAGGASPGPREGSAPAGPLTSAGTRASGGSPRWASWTPPRSPRTAPRTEPGAVGTEGDRLVFSPAPPKH